MPKNKEIRNVAIVGTGVIGASWAALYLARGLTVVATDQHQMRKPTCADTLITPGKISQ